MLYGRYTFSCIFEDDAILPEYKGSTFRGVFGHALKRLVCVLKRQDCADCILRSQCVYALVFESQAWPDKIGENPRVVSPPHPYVIEPPDDTTTNYSKGDPFSFTLILFGKANEYLPYFIYAFDKMEKIGIGKRIGGKRPSFSLEDVSVNGNIVYRSEDGKIKEGVFTEPLTLDGLKPDKDKSVNGLELSLVTPLRVKYENRLEATMPFHVLTRAMLRRTSSLSQHFGKGLPNIDYRGLVERAKAVSINASSLRWFDWKRYSSKQDQEMFMGGITGKVAYSGDLTEFIPLLRFCKKVHLGKQTTFGLGKIKMRMAS